MFICKCEYFHHNGIISYIQYQVPAKEVGKKNQKWRNHKKFLPWIIAENYVGNNKFSCKVNNYKQETKKIKQMIYLIFKFIYFILNIAFLWKAKWNMWKRKQNIWNSRNNSDYHIPLEIYEFVERIKTVKTSTKTFTYYEITFF